jgi:hypothetical protein
VGCVRGGGKEASLPRTAQMNPLGKGGRLPRLLSISVLCSISCLKGTVLSDLEFHESVWYGHETLKINKNVK